MCTGHKVPKISICAYCFFFTPLIILVLTSHMEWCILKPVGSSYFTGSYGKSVLQLPYRSQNIILSVNKPLNTHLWTLQLKLKNKTLHNLFLTNKLHTSSWYFTVVSSNQNTKQVIKTNYWVSTSAALFISFLMCMPRIPEVHVIMQVMLIILSSEPLNRVRCNAVENLICWNGNGNQR